MHALADRDRKEGVLAQIPCVLGGKGHGFALLIAQRSSEVIQDSQIKRRCGYGELVDIGRQTGSDMLTEGLGRRSVPAGRDAWTAACKSPDTASPLADGHALKSIG